MADILHLLPIHAPREKVYAAITTAGSIREWFSRDAALDSRVGGNGEIRFAERTRIIKLEVEELEPPARITWRILSAAMPTWANTRVEFKLGEDGAGAMLHFAQRGFQATDDFFAMSTTAWASFLFSLKQYLETGTGTPHPDDILSRSPGAR